MSEDRLDRIEKIVESNSRAIEAWANESAEYKRQTTEAIERLTSISQLLVESNSQLTNVVTMLAARQQDQENRIDRLEQ